MANEIGKVPMKPRLVEALPDDFPDALMAISPGGEILFWNKGAEHTFGYSRDEALGRALTDLIVPPDRTDETDQWTRKALQSGLVTYESVGRRKDGALAYVDVSIKAVRNAQGRVEYLAVSQKDVTRLKCLRVAQLLDAKFRGLLEAAPDATVIVDRDSRIALVNSRTEQLFGYSREELLGQSVELLLPERFHRAGYFADPRPRLIGTGLDLFAIGKDGSEFPVEISLNPMKTEEGPLVTAAIRDISERKRLDENHGPTEETSHETEQLAAMGMLLPGVAHELNNPLSVVLGQTALLRQTMPEGPLRTRVDQIASAAERCARVLQNFLALSRQRPPERQRVSLNQVVREAVELLAYSLRVDSVEVKLDLADDLPLLWADAHQLHQVMVNLATNAHQAIRETSPPRRLTFTSRYDPGLGRVSLQVADTGLGLPPEVQARTTAKPPEQGTGLGLSVCKGIVEEHGGVIRVENQPGRGTAFRIELPAEARPSVKPEAQAAKARPPIRGKAILVVDDEPEVAAVLTDLLSADDHRVETAANGALALDKLRERAYDLIVSDIKMPELDGPGLYRELERRHPQLVQRFIFMTGDAMTPETTGFLERTGAPSFSKPFALQEVQRLVQQTLCRE